MKDIKEYITESVSGSIEFQGQKFELDHIIKSNVHQDIYKASCINSFSSDDWQNLKKQGCKYVLCFPPHMTQSNEKVDKFQIKAFIKGKRMSDMYKHTQMYALYDTKTGECVNKDDIKAYKVIRFE